MKKPIHGGKRKGSGRKQKEPTVIMRVPESLVPKVKALIEKHKSVKKTRISIHTKTK